MYRSARSVAILCAVTALSFACARPHPCGPAGPPSMLLALERPGDFESHRASSSDPDWHHGNADARPIEPGQTLVLADLEGPGRITHIWCTVNAADPFYPRSLTLRMYWDGREEPSVEAPIGDFFAVGHGLDVPVNSFPVQVSSEGRARNCFWPMPFRKSARITVTNDSPDKKVHSFYYYIDWQNLPSLPRDTMYFHAQYRQEFPCEMGKNYLLLDTEGDGVYVGTVQSVHMDEASWFGEGDDFFYIDGSEEPVLRGTGTEDYYGDAWGFRQFNNPFYGVSVWEGYKADDRGTAYRWHLADPVRFHESLRVEIEHKGVLFYPDGRVKTGFAERADYMSSVAFWYQRGQAKRFATMPPAEDRIVRGTVIEAESLIDRLSAMPAAAEVQKIGGASGGSHVFFTPPDDDAWIEFPVEIPEGGRYVVKVALTHSWDYGTYEIRLDGEQIDGARNLHSRDIRIETEHLGTHRFEKGTHKLRLVCTGRHPQAVVRETDEPGHYLGVDYIYYRKLFPRQ